MIATATSAYDAARIERELTAEDGDAGIIKLSFNMLKALGRGRG